VSVRAPNRPELSTPVPQGSAPSLFATASPWGGHRQTRVLNDAWQKPASGRWNGRNESAFHVRQEQDGKPEHNLGPGGANGDLSTRQAPISLTMQPIKAAPSGQTNALVSTSVGVVRNGGGGQFVSAVKPASLPNSVSRRRIPASCPFPRPVVAN